MLLSFQSRTQHERLWQILKHWKPIHYAQIQVRPGEAHRMSDANFLTRSFEGSGLGPHNTWIALSSHDPDTDFTNNVENIPHSRE